MHLVVHEIAPTHAELCARQFEALLGRAELEGANSPLRACRTYWAARRLSKREGLGREGEADLGIGLCLMGLDSISEALACLQRAHSLFCRQGDLRRRGWCEVALAEADFRQGRQRQAHSRLRAAHALLAATSPPDAARAELSR